MQARYYDPVIGRFYSNDPVGVTNVHTFNRYAYANNNPYKYIDPDGKTALAACALGPVACGGALAVTGIVGLAATISAATSDPVGAMNAAHNESSADDAIDDVLNDKESTGKKGEYVGDPDTFDDDLGKVDGGGTKEYPNGTKVGNPLDDGSQAEAHGSSGKGTDGSKGKNVKPKTPTIKIRRPRGKQNITIRYPDKEK